MTPDSPTSPKASHRILRKFAYLFSAHWVRVTSNANCQATAYLTYT